MFEESKAFDLFITELLDEKLRTLTATDGIYSAVKTKMELAFDALEDDFNSQEIRLIEDFQGLICNMADLENRYLYFQGFTDCVKLLKRLAVY
ncbi:MAG: hypothetical protein FWH16_02120 [Oscillospiraceae bacterium]|nr:hypothetical protein [Oscillospiraceae bacterium]